MTYMLRVEGVMGEEVWAGCGVRGGDTLIVTGELQW